MRWRSIARKDMRDAGRSRTIWILFALFTLVSIAVVAIEAGFAHGDVASVVDQLSGVLALLVPIIALLLGYKSVSHERIDGSIVLLLSFPHSRRDVARGKYVGRSVVLLVPLLVALSIAGMLAVILTGEVGGVIRYPWFMLLTAVYGLGFLAIAIGISMSTRVERRVTLSAFGAYLLLVTFWDSFVELLTVILFRFNVEALAVRPSWTYLADLLKPSEAYYRLLHVGFDLDRAMVYFDPGVPWYVDWWTAVLVLLAWIGLPLLVGLRRFETADL